MAFSVTVSSPMKKADRISRNLGVYAGKITISSYATTLVECTAITKFFKDGGQSGFTKGLVSVTPSAISESGFAFSWDYTTGAFRCFCPTAIVFSGSATGGNVTWGSALGRVGMAAASVPGTFIAPGKEAVANDAVGTVSFVAIGFI